jgi:CheY-like chemotaxis protein
MDGFETAREMRAMDELRDVLLIAVSGYAQDDDRRRTAREGFNAHLSKPVEPQQILDAIEGKQGPGVLALSHAGGSGVRRLRTRTQWRPA